MIRRRDEGGRGPATSATGLHQHGSSQHLLPSSVIVNNTPVSIVSIDQRGGDTGLRGSGGAGLRREERLIATTTATHTATSTKMKISSAFTSDTLSVCVRATRFVTAREMK